MHTDPILIINPDSGRHTSRSVGLVVAELARQGMVPRVVSIRTPLEANLLFSDIRRQRERPFIIVAAGDGTVNAVVNGLLPGTATLAVLPLGTSNVLAAELGITSVEAGIQRIVTGTTRSLSVGVLHLEGSSHRFVLMAGIGLDGSVVRDIWPLGKKIMKQGAYALSALASAFRWDNSLISIHTPDRTIQCHSVIVCNASRYGGDFIIAPEGDLFSPELTAVCIRKNRRRSYLRLAFELFRGKSDTSSELVRIPVDGLEIRGTKPIQIDGDFIGYSPARITAVPDFARIIV